MHDPERFNARSRLLTRQFAAALAAVAFVALAVRVLAVEIVDPRVGEVSDASAYHLIANNLADGRGYIRPFDLELLGTVHATAEYPPLFTAVLAVPAKLGLNTVHSQRLFMTLVGTATVVLIGLLGRRLAGDTAGLIAAGLAAIYPMLWQSDAALMSETLFAFLVIAMLGLAYRAIRAPSLVSFAVLGGVAGLATLTRSEGAILALVMIPPLAWRARDLLPRRRLAIGGAALAALFVVMMPWMIRNAVVFHRFIPVSNNVGALSGANCELTYYGPGLGSWRSTFGGDPAVAGLCFTGFDVEQADFDEGEVARAHFAQGTDYARAHLGRLAFPVVPARLGRTWGVFRVGQQIDLATFEGRTKTWETAGTWMYWFLLPLAVTGTVLLARRRVPIWPLVSTAVAVSITTVLTYGNQRFRLTAEPAIVLAAAIALDAGQRRLARGQPGGTVRDAAQRGEPTS